MNELTSGETLQQILERRERAAAMSTLATIVASVVAIAITVSVLLDVSASPPAVEAAENVAIAPPPALEGLQASP